MRDFTITSDSTVDIGPERMRELNVPYVSLKCIHKDGEFSDDMTEATAKRIYGLMRDGNKISTSQALADDYVRLWQPILEKGHDIVHLAFQAGCLVQLEERSWRQICFWINILEAKYMCPIH